MQLFDLDRGVSSRRTISVHYPAISTLILNIWISTITFSFTSLFWKNKIKIYIIYSCGLKKISTWLDRDHHTHGDKAVNGACLPMSIAKYPSRLEQLDSACTYCDEESRKRMFKTPSKKKRRCIADPLIGYHCLVYCIVLTIRKRTIILPDFIWKLTNPWLFFISIQF